MFCFKLSQAGGRGDARWQPVEMSLSTRTYVAEIEAALCPDVGSGKPPAGRVKRRSVGDIEIFYDTQSTRINLAASWLVGFAVCGDAIVVPGGIRSKILYQLFRRYTLFCLCEYEKILHITIQYNLTNH